MDLEQGKWKALTPGQRRAIIIAGAVTTVMQLVMLWDIRRLPADRIRGSKRAWTAASFVRPFGPVAYWAWGRRRPD